MAQVVVLSWDSVTGVLMYVPVDGGNGGQPQSLVVNAAWVADVANQCDAASLPQVGDLEVDGDGQCLLELSGPTATRCSAKWKKPSIRLRSRQGGADMAELAPQMLGLTDPDLAAQAEYIGSFLLFKDAIGGLVGCWECEGGLSGWLDRVRLRRTERDEMKAAAQRAADADRRFVNPYTFVPFPEAIGRDRPAGHHLLGPGRLSGTFRVRFEATSPMQAPEGTVSGQRLRLPGSSVKGAVRSLHETVAGGCLRVLDDEFVPSYRDVAAVPSSEWTLAVVECVTRDGQPLTVRVCDPVVWVRAAQLMTAWGRELATGCRVTLTPPTTMTSLDRYELADGEVVRRGGDWVVLLSDAGARRPETKLKKPGAYFAACGRVGDDTAVLEVEEAAWRQFQRAVAGAREVTQRRAAERARQTTAQWVPVKFRGQEIGRRKAVTGSFVVGDVLWAKRNVGSDGVVGLSHAMIWRHVGTGPLGERVPAHLHACPDSPQQPPVSERSARPGRESDRDMLLCPSCRLFGAADTRSRSVDTEAQQRAYAGHVRFSDVVSNESVALTTFQRAPMGAPRPGAGQLYLSYDKTTSATEGQVPTREWGAAPDCGRARLLSSRLVRGRKFYWHADPTLQAVPRHIARDHQINPRMLVRRQLAPAGTVLDGTVTFDNLSEAELGGLLATLEPGRILPAHDPGSRRLRLRLGGGKPLGLGSFEASVTSLRVWSAHSRYGAADLVVPEAERYVAAFVSAVPPEVMATWPAVTAVLAEDTVDPARVWYPPGAYWSDQMADDKGKTFDEPFAFFTGTSGMYLAKGEARPLLPLPDPTVADQSLPIIRKLDLGKGSGKTG